MKKSTIALLTFAVAILTASCRKENISEYVAEYTPMTINAVANGIDIPATKTSLAFKFDVNWNQNDQIYVKDGSNKNTFTLQSGEGTPNGSFVQDGEEQSFNGEVEAYYPSTIVKELEWHLEWPAEQKNDQTIPMYCKKTLSSDGKGEQRMDFTSLGSVLRIAFATPVSDIKLKSITIKDDETKMSGIFTVEDGKAIIDENGNDYITLDLGDNGVDVSNKINYFNIAVPAGHYQKFSITFTATDGNQCVMTGENINIVHNTVGTLSLTGKEFNPFGQGAADVKAEAGIQGNKVKWVQLWENGPKFAEFNVGATSAADYGGYYTWGGTYRNGEGITWNDDHNTTNKGTGDLTSTDDTATNLWGSNWRMPTKAELEALLNPTNCTVMSVFDPNDDTKFLGKKITGNGSYASNSVFLPAAGACIYGDVYDQGRCGNYWSSTPNGNNYAYFLDFNSGGQYVNDYIRLCGYSVRAVLAE